MVHLLPIRVRSPPTIGTAQAESDDISKREAVHNVAHNVLTRVPHDLLGRANISIDNDVDREDRRVFACVFPGISKQAYLRGKVRESAGFLPQV